MIAGKFIGVMVDGGFVKCEVNSTYSIDAEMLETASYGRKGWRDYIYGYKGWQLTVSSALNNGSMPSAWNKIVEKLINTNEQFEVYWRTFDNYGESMLFRGMAIIPSWSGEAPVEGRGTQSITFQGCGEPEFFAEEVWRRINAMPAPADKDIIVDMR